MSTRIATLEPTQQEPIALADLRAYFQQAAKPSDRWRVGAEFEKFAVERDSGRALSYHEPGGVRDLLAGLAGRFDWLPVVNQRGYLTALVRDEAVISLEPGGQVELSTTPVTEIGEIASQLTTHLAELRAVADPERTAWLAAGVTPLARVEDIALMPRVRHGVMAEYLPRRSPLALHMMKATASTQVTLDFADEADAARKFTTSLKVGPIVNAVWGNAPLYAGHPTGCASYRGRIWQGMDPDRSGLLLDLLERGFSFDAWVDYLLDAPMMFTCIDGRYRPAEGRTFRDFLRTGQDGYFPALPDWEVQLTTVFPEVRLKKFLEIRGADATAGPLAVAVPALWKGLLYDADALDAAADLAASIRAADLPAVFEAAFTHGLAAEYRGRPLSAWCREIAGLAADGLRRQAEWSGRADERGFLDPVFAVLERGRSPGADCLAAGPAAPPEIVRRFEYGATNL